MSNGLCPNCGASVSLGQNSSRTCGYCNSVVTRAAAEMRFAEVQATRTSGTLLLARTAMDGGRHREASALYDKVIEQDPTSVEAWVMKGYLILRLSGPPGLYAAKPAWSTAMSVSPQPADVGRRIGRLAAEIAELFFPFRLDAHDWKPPCELSFGSNHPVLAPEWEPTAATIAAGRECNLHLGWNQARELESVIAYGLNLNPGDERTAYLGFRLTDELLKVPFVKCIEPWEVLRNQKATIRPRHAAYEAVLRASPRWLECEAELTRIAKLRAEHIATNPDRAQLEREEEFRGLTNEERALRYAERHPRLAKIDAALAKGHCFVVTAAMGDDRQPEVLLLRNFRDEVLVRTPTGRALIGAYWIVGPWMAKAIEGSPARRALARAFIVRPAVRLVRWLRGA